MEIIKENIETILFTKKDLKNITKKLARQIEKDYKNKELICICVLQGAFHFYSDLIRELDNNKVTIYQDTIGISSYNGDKSTGNINLYSQPQQNLKNKNILIVEDLIETGTSLLFLQNYIKKTYSPKSIETCVLFDKPELHDKNINIKYIGQNIGNEFIIGYGFDYNQKYRNLKNIHILKKE